MAAGDFRIYRGSSGRVHWPIPYDPAGYSYNWVIQGPDPPIHLSTEDGTLFVSGSGRLLIWPYTIEQTRTFPLGRFSSFEIQSTAPDGGQTIEITGAITGLGGLNDD